MSTRILLVEDESAIADMVCFHLKKADYQCQAAVDAAAADQLLKQQVPDLILLDWMLPDESGYFYARRLRQDKFTKEIPIIMLTARTDERDKINALESAADDYVTKPFSPKELLARIKAVLRRASPHRNAEQIEFNGVVLDPQAHRLVFEGTNLKVGPTEFRLLHFFLTHTDRAFSREQLLNHVWGRDAYVEERTVDVHIRRLRKVLQPMGLDRYIETVHGVGYRFVALEKV
ncbi:MAG: phosphate regulon transcriptional regulatory protein PhoB [Gammaproteobacteria bacterium]|nr:MAG: phosphate regulon transcriptional regulatory protein PhoB [Gammaproteobacteria bacterium]